MKSNLTLTVFFLLFLSANAYSQFDSTKLLHRTFKTTLVNMEGKTHKGFLAELLDSSLVISHSSIQFGRSALSNKPMETYIIPDISYVKIRTKGSTGRGMLTGALIGMGIGVLTGLISGDDRGNTNNGGQWFSATAGEKAAILGLVGTFNGGIIGGIIGAIAHKKFIISGKKENFDKMKTTVLEKAYRKS